MFAMVLSLLGGRGRLTFWSRPACVIFVRNLSRLARLFLLELKDRLMI